MSNQTVTFRNTFIALVQARLIVKLSAAVNHFSLRATIDCIILSMVPHLHFYVTSNIYCLLYKWTAKARFHVKEMCICQCLGRKDAS